VVQLLRSKNINTLDVLVLTHPHLDHYGGLIPVLNHFSIKEFWWNGEDRGQSRNEETPKTWTDFEEARVRADKEVLVTQGMRRSFQRARVEVLNAGGEYPNTSKGKDINNDSIVLLISYRGVKVLLTGDIEAEEGRDLVDDYCPSSTISCRKLNVDILKIPHHGSSHFSSRFVQLADAEVALISAGFENKQFHHPRLAAIAAYEEFGAKCFYSTSTKEGDHITLKIGPNRDQYTIDGSDTGFSYWADLDEEEVCPNESHQGFCVEYWRKECSEQP
jgi:competence protein ComEC